MSGDRRQGDRFRWEDLPSILRDFLAHTACDLPSDKETVEQHFYRTVIAPDMHDIGRTMVDLGVWDDHKDLWFAALMAGQTLAYPEPEPAAEILQT